ncbi:MAG: LCP family protein [Bacilli bacterium]|nr:LCP family protein [Bacilli bacterium]
MKNANKILVILFGICTIIFLGTVGYIQILPSKYLYPLIIGEMLLLLLLLFLTFKKNTNKIISSCTSIVLLAFLTITVVGEVYVYKTYYFLDKLNNKTEETNTYYIVALKENTASKIEDVKDKQIVIYTKQDDTLEKARTALKEMISFKEKEYIDIQKMTSDLLNKKEDFILLKESHKSILEETNTEFKDKTKVIYTFSIKTKIEQTSQDKLNPLKEPFNIFISGIDVYGDIMTKSQGDVNIVITVNPNTYEILLTVVPRDYYVKLHGIEGSKDKLTHAAYYGIDMSVKTVEDLLETHIPYYIRVNFDTVIKLVDQIGGIDIYSDTSFKAFTNRKVYIKKGNNHLNGTEALAFSRERMTYASGDRHRGQNQQVVLSAIIKKISTSPSLLTKYNSILQTLENSFQTNIETNTMTSYINKQLDTMPSWTIKTYNLNGSDSHNMTYSLGIVRYVMEPNIQTVEQAKGYINGMLKGNKFTQLGL